MAEFWEWLVNQMRYEEWPHFLAIMIGIGIGGVIQTAYVQPWFDRAWPKRTRGARIVAGIGLAWAAIMVIAIVGTFIFESGLVP